MTYAEIEAINRETAELTKRITLKWGIIDILMIIICLTMIVLAIRLIWEEHRERKERKLQEVFTGYNFKPVVTDTVQYDQFGTEYRLMGAPKALR